MPSKPKDQHCFYCGEFIGRYVRMWRELQTCGKSECEREARSQEREAESAREERARADGFERY